MITKPITTVSSTKEGFQVTITCNVKESEIIRGVYKITDRLQSGEKGKWHIVMHREEYVTDTDLILVRYSFFTDDISKYEGEYYFK